MKRVNRVLTVLVFLFHYAPMLVLAVASFNQGKDMAVFTGFTLSRYRELFQDSRLLALLGNSALVAVLSSLLATVMGTAACLGIYKMRRSARSLVMSVTNIPMTNPEIVTGVSLALLFALTGVLLRLKGVLGFWTLLPRTTREYIYSMSTFSRASSVRSSERPPVTSGTASTTTSFVLTTQFIRRSASFA